MRKKLKLTGFERLRKHRFDGNTDYFGSVETEERSMVDLYLCFLSLRRVERERRRGERGRVAGALVRGRP
jgi:hypothetical protein